MDTMKLLDGRLELSVSDARKLYEELKERFDPPLSVKVVQRYMVPHRLGPMVLLDPPQITYDPHRIMSTFEPSHSEKLSQDWT